MIAQRWHDAAAVDALAHRLRAAGCVFADDEARLLLDAAADPAQLAAMTDRRLAGEPLEHVLGRLDFAGTSILLGPGVFVPRRRSELLVRTALALPVGVRGGDAAALVVVDLCCGSGAVGLSVALGLGGSAGGAREGRALVELHAVDLDPVAVDCARRNLDRRTGPAGQAAVTAQVHSGDLYAALPRRLRGRVDLLLAVPPYVPTGELAFLPAEARLHEPALALDGGLDGLAVARRIITGARRWLAAGGAVLVETSAAQVEALTGLVEGAGMTPQVVADDEPEAVVVVGVSPD